MSVVRYKLEITFLIASLETLYRVWRNLTEHKLNVHYQVCGVFFCRADTSTKMDVLAYAWLRHFRFLFQHRILTNLDRKQFFSGRSSTKMAPLSLIDIPVGIFGFSSTAAANVGQNSTGSEYPTSCKPKLCFSGNPSIKMDLWPLIGWGIFDFNCWIDWFLYLSGS